MALHHPRVMDMFCRLWLFVFILKPSTLSFAGETDTRYIPEEELEADFWLEQGRLTLQEALYTKPNTNIAKNIILFVGDGMGMSTITAARILKGQKAGLPGEGSRLHFETFPNIGLAKTYTVDHQIGDSAGTATAFLCGTKAMSGTVGLGPGVKKGDCESSRGREQRCIIEIAQQAGKSTGLITTSHISHATPAGLYASVADREWEADSDIPHKVQNQGCLDIGAQLMNPVGRNINVVMGGGRSKLTSHGDKDPEERRKKGHRRDGRNLIKEWLHHQKHTKKRQAHYVWSKEDFDAIDPEKTDYMLGLFAHSHMKFDGDRYSDTGGEPSISEMVKKAIQILQKNEKGFFLLVEGARIDHAHHGGVARKALEETIAMDDAVETALSLVDTEDTLVIVTADHSHPLTIASYASRGNPILGLVDHNSPLNSDGLSDVDALPYTTLTYANGPGYSLHYQRPNLTGVNTDGPYYKQAAAVPLKSTSHDGSDVPIYAKGPMAHLFHSTQEQNYIFQVMTYAACLSNYKTRCRHRAEKLEGDYFFVNINSSPHFSNKSFLLMISFWTVFSLLSVNYMVL